MVPHHDLLAAKWPEVGCAPISTHPIVMSALKTQLAAFLSLLFLYMQPQRRHFPPQGMRTRRLSLLVGILLMSVDMEASRGMNPSLIAHYVVSMIRCVSYPG